MTRYGEGSIWYDEKRGRWVQQLFLGRKPDGKPLRPKVSAPTKRELRDKVRQLRADHEDGLVVGDDMTVAEFLSDWLANVAPARSRAGRPVSASTLAKDRALVEGHLIPGLGHHRLIDLRPEHVEALLRAKAAEGLSADWVRRMREKLAQALRHAERRGRVRRNAAALALVPHGMPAPKRRRALTLEQAKALMAAAEGDRLEALIVVGLMLGLRPSELYGLTWDDIDFDAGTVRISGVLRDGQRVDEVKVNHERAKRIVDMPERVAAVLRRHRHEQALERMAARSWGDERLVFTSSVGTPLDGHNVLRSLRRLCEKAGIGDDWTVYELRHTAASLLYDAGVHKERIADILGHADTRVLDLVYRHPTRDSLPHAAGPMNDMFG